MHNLSTIVSKNEEEFDLSLSNVATGVHKNEYWHILERISYFRSDPFTLVDLDLP